MTAERRNARSVDIDLLPTERILQIINEEDASVPGVVASVIPQIAKAVEFAVETIRGGGRVFYAGAGTSGRIAVQDAVECPPTFSTPPEWIQAVLAGGSKALTQALEGAEDNEARAHRDLKDRKLTSTDLLIGVAASGQTPYTVAAIAYARLIGARSIAVVCVPGSPMSKVADLTITADVGPEVITGSTRMKAGTSQKLILNMFSTATMIRLGMTYSNWMINVSMTNNKLQERGIQILREILGVDTANATKLARESGGKLKQAVLMGALNCSLQEAEDRLSQHDGSLRKALGPPAGGRE